MCIQKVRKSSVEFYFHSMLLAQSYAHFLHSLKCLLTCYQLPSAFVFHREPQKHLNIIASAWDVLRLLSIHTQWFWCHLLIDWARLGYYDSIHIYHINLNSCMFIFLSLFHCDIQLVVISVLVAVYSNYTASKQHIFLWTPILVTEFGTYMYTQVISYNNNSKVDILLLKFTSLCITIVKECHRL